MSAEASPNLPTSRFRRTTVVLVTYFWRFLAFDPRPPQGLLNHPATRYFARALLISAGLLLIVGPYDYASSPAYGWQIALGGSVGFGAMFAFMSRDSGPWGGLAIIPILGAYVLLQRVMSLVQTLVPATANPFVLAFFTGSTGLFVAIGVGFFPFLGAVSRSRWTVGKLIALGVLYTAVAVPLRTAPINPMVFALVAVSSFPLGLAIGERLRESFAEFLQAWPYLRSIASAALGYLLGYIFIAIVFAGWYAAIYHADASSFRNAEGGPVAQFAYYSITTLPTLGYSDIRPVSSLAKVLTVSETFVGIAWTVVVFAALVARLQPRLRALEPIEQPEGRGPAISA